MSKCLKICWRVSLLKNAQTCPASKPSEHFFSEAKASLTGQFQPLFAEEEDINRPFVEQVLAATEYDCFYKMMRDAASSQRGNLIAVQRQSESKK